MPVSSALMRLAAQTGAALRLDAGDVLRIVAVESEQVADVALYADEPREAFSPGRTIDYNSAIAFRCGDVLYSTESTPLARIVEDTVGVHDMLLAPCSRRMFELRGELHHPSCHENLSTALRPFGIQAGEVTATLNVFMDVRVNADGSVKIYPPASRRGDVFALEALTPLIAGVAACSSERTNAGRCKPVAYEVIRRPRAWAAATENI